MSENNFDLSAGKILIAQPYMQDGHFKRSVIGLTEHNEKGSVGFILNKPVNIDLQELIPDLKSEHDYKVYYGGPVATDTIHYVHNVGDLLEGSTKILPSIYWGGDFEKLLFLISSELILPKNIRFYIGYSGWSEGQLQDEMKKGTWVLSDWFANYLFQSKATKLWSQAMEHKGDIFSVLAQIPSNLSEN